MILKTQRILAHDGVLRMVDLPQELIGRMGSNSLKASNFHRNRHHPRKPSGKGGILDRDPLLEWKQFPDRNEPPRQDQSRDVLDLEKIPPMDEPT
jgi:hypothetical protein